MEIEIDWARKWSIIEKMAEIQFNEEQEYQRPAQADRKPFFVRVVLATKIVSTERDAEYVLVGVVVLCLIAAFTIPFLFSGPKGVVQTPSSPTWPHPFVQ